MHRLPGDKLARKRGPIAAAFASVVLLALGGCIAPQPDIPVPAQWSTERQEAVRADASDPRSPGWWAVLNDPLLVGLVERSRKDDLDVDAALARVRAARARRDDVGVDRFSTLDADAAALAPGSDAPRIGTSHALFAPSFDASWERGALGDAQATEAETEVSAGVDDVRDAIVTLFAEIALNYVEVRSFQTRLSLADEHIRSQSEIYLITRWRRQAGLTTKRGFDRARLSLEQTRAQIPLLQAGLEQARNRLAVLLDQPPAELVAELAETKAIPSARVGLAVGVPADALRRRPDVRRAERELAADWGSLAGDTLRFSLAGSIGLEAMAPPGRALPAKASAPIAERLAPFDADSLRQNIEAKTPLQEQALMRYEAAVITALKEVDNVLVAYTKGEARRESLERATRSAKSAAELANKRYIAGQISFQALLDAQRSLLSLQNQLATSEGEVTSNLIRLYKALGGGWTAPDATLSRTRN